MAKIKTKKLNDGTLQLGYHNGKGWVGLTNIRRVSNGHLGTGWKSDNWPGVEKTITDWKKRVQGYYDADSRL